MSRPVAKTGKRASAPKVDTQNDIINYKLDQIHSILEKNQKDIEDLKKQVAMGQGGIKAIFILGAFVGLLLGIAKYLKFWG
jgi:hypothetical protein